MPISRSFKDISITFDKNFVTDDLMVTKDFNAIKQSVKNLITTVPGERFFNPNIGSRITDLLFEPLDFINANLVKSEIEYTIKAFEPRVNLINVIVDQNMDDNGYDVEIEFEVIGLPEKTQSLSLFLERTRA
jgi:phage baseplate assembly protein W